MLLKNPFDRAGALVLIETGVLERLAPFRQNQTDDLESGGILLGLRRANHLHITEATFPDRSDRRKRFAFHRAAANHQRIATRRWAETNQTLDYVGEWHTHPEETAQPSSVDLLEWQAICKRCPRDMVFFVLGQANDWIGIGRSPEIKPLELL